MDQKIKISVSHLALLSLKFLFSVSVLLTGVLQIILLSVLITLLPRNTEEPVIFFPFDSYVKALGTTGEIMLAA